MTITDHPHYALFLHAWIVAIMYNGLLTDATYIDRVYPDRVAPHLQLSETREHTILNGLFSRN